MATSPRDKHPDPHQRSQDARQRIVEMARSIRDDRAGGPVDHYLVILQDRLPSWLSALIDLEYRAGRHTVEGNLIEIARTGIDYYRDVQTAALPAFASPAFVVGFRK